MLTHLEYIHFGKNSLDSRHLPLSYYKKNLGRINWSYARMHLPLDFQAQYMPEERKLEVDEFDETGEFDFPIVNGVLICHGYYGPLNKQDFEQIMSHRKRARIFSNQNIPEEWFEPYMSSFTDEEWAKFLEGADLCEGQVNRYHWLAERYEDFIPLSQIPYVPENFRSIFSHRLLTKEFIQEHLEDAIANYEFLISTKAGYQLALENQLLTHKISEMFIDMYVKIEDLDRYPQLISGSTFTHNDLPIWFIDKHREKITWILNSCPSKETFAWLKEHRPDLLTSWLEDEDVESPKFRHRFGTAEINIQREKIFQNSIKKAMTLHFI